MLDDEARERHQGDGEHELQAVDADEELAGHELHDAAVNDDGAQRTENAHRAAGAPEQSLAEQHTCKEAPKALSRLVIEKE